MNLAMEHAINFHRLANKQIAKPTKKITVHQISRTQAVEVTHG